MEAFLGNSKWPHVDTHLDKCMYVPCSVIEYWEVYTVGSRRIGQEVAVLFMDTVQLEGLRRNHILLRATFDDTTMVNVIDSILFATIKE